MNGADVINELSRRGFPYMSAVPSMVHAFGELPLEWLVAIMIAEGTANAKGVGIRIQSVGNALKGTKNSPISRAMPNAYDPGNGYHYANYSAYSDGWARSVADMHDWLLWRLGKQTKNDPNFIDVVSLWGGSQQYRRDITTYLNGLHVRYKDRKNPGLHTLLGAPMSGEQKDAFDNVVDSVDSLTAPTNANPGLAQNDLNTSKQVQADAGAYSGPAEYYNSGEAPTRLVSGEQLAMLRTPTADELKDIALKYGGIVGGLILALFDNSTSEADREQAFGSSVFAVAEMAVDDYFKQRLGFLAGVEHKALEMTKAYFIKLVASELAVIFSKLHGTAPVVNG